MLVFLMLGIIIGALKITISVLHYNSEKNIIYQKKNLIALKKCIHMIYLNTLQYISYYLEDYDRFNYTNKIIKLQTDSTTSKYRITT